MNRDIFLNKRRSLETCLTRVRDKYAAGRAALDDLDTLEIILLNLQRACEISIDLAMHAVASHSLGIPQESRDAFRMLQQAGWIGDDLARCMQNMVGFRNVAIHQYQEISLPVVAAILENHIGDFHSFLEALKSRL